MSITIKLEEEEFKYRGWVRVLGIIFPYLIIVGIFQYIGASVVGIDVENLETHESTYQHLAINFFSLTGTFFVIWLFMKFVDKEPFIKVGFYTKNRLNDFVVGILIGLIIMTLGYGYLLLTNQIYFDKLNYNLTELIQTIALFITVSIAEEMLLRGYILKNLLFSFNKYIALLVSSILFSLMHSFNPNVDFFSLFNLFLAGILLGLSYIHTRNLWFPIALHLSWNLFQTLYGFNVSGQDVYSLIEFKMNEPNLINGGLFGFEGSYLSIIAQIITITAIAFYYKRKKELRVV